MKRINLTIKEKAHLLEHNYVILQRGGFEIIITLSSKQGVKIDIVNNISRTSILKQLGYEV